MVVVVGAAVVVGAPRAVDLRLHSRKVYQEAMDRLREETIYRLSHGASSGGYTSTSVSRGTISRSAGLSKYGCRIVRSNKLLLLHLATTALLPAPQQDISPVAVIHEDIIMAIAAMDTREATTSG